MSTSSTSVTAAARRIVVKVGSSLVTNEGRGWEDAVISITGSCVRNGMPIAGTWTLHERIRRGQSKTFFPENFRDVQGFKPEIDVAVESTGFFTGWLAKLLG